MTARAARASSYSQLNYLTLRQLLDTSYRLHIPQRLSHSRPDAPTLRVFCSSTKHRQNVNDDKTVGTHPPSADSPSKQIGANGTFRNVLSEVNHEKQPQNRRRKINPTWKPTVAQGAHDLAALLDSIKALTVRSRTIDVEAEQDAQDKESLDQTDREEDELPLSPFEVLSGAHNRKPKRRPTREELDKLRSNPWAKMLAASLRQCMATRARFPAPLMLDIGQVVSPHDLEVYLMPDAIADLQDFNERLQSGKMSKAIPLKGGSGDKLKILPYELIFEKLTDSFIALDSKSKQGRTRSGAVSKALYPSRWVQNIEKISAYNRASKDYYDIAEKQGLREGLHQRPTSPLDTDKVLWQPSIVGRIPNIMRQRVLLCLQRIAEVDIKYNDGSLKYLYRFEWPADAELDLSIVEQDLNSGRDFWNDMGDIEADGAISGTVQGQGSPVDGRPPITVQPSQLDAEATRLRNDHHTWIPGSFLLHLGPANPLVQTTDTLMDSTNSLTNPWEVPSVQHSKFIPPMMNLGRYRLPVFNLYAMFGTQFNDVLSRLLARYAVFRPDSALATRNVDDMDHPASLNSEANFLILVKSTAPCAHFLVRELWQLWRYVGGTDCLVAETSELATRKTKIDMTHNMSPQAWNQLYQLLGMSCSDAPVRMRRHAGTEGLQRDGAADVQINKKAEEETGEAY